MKELSIEQKAKRYDEAIKKAESLYKVAEPMSGCNVIIETLFPELKESEDERIRKDIIWCLKHSGIKESNPINPHVTTITKDAIAWLEKQYEQKVSEYDIVKTIKERIIEHFDNHLIIDKCFSIGGLKDDILKIINEVKFAKQGEPTDILDDAVLDSNKDGLIADTIRCKIEKQGEQKPAWSEDDKDVLEDVEEAIINYWHGQSQEDLLDWLKSLRPQDKWKPSGFHLECIEDAISLYEKHGINAIGLKEILEQLKKLREE